MLLEGALLFAVAAGGLLAGFAWGRGRGSSPRESVVAPAVIPATRSETPAGFRPIDALARLEPADGRFEELLRSLTVGIVTLDRSGHVVSANGAAGAILDFGERSVIGRAMIECVPSYDLDRRVRDALDGAAWRGKITLTSPSERVLTVATLPIQTGAMVIASDETRLHELERTRRDFVTNVSHELRTPLSSISLMIETILAAREDERVLEMFLPQVKREIDRMIALVVDLLDLAKAETGHLRLRLERLDLRDVAREIVQTLEPKALQSDVALELVVPETPIEVEADRDRLAQIFVNLIDNALRHTPAGGEVVVTLGSSRQRASIEVSDTGTGIPYNDLPYLFERFYVVERSRARGTGGTGLGLSIVKQIVEAHGGRVSADSEFGYGATFVVTLPLVEDRARASGLDGVEAEPRR